jgi:hypothetical protein
MDGETLMDYAIGIACIETATKNGLQLLTSGSELSVTKSMPDIPGYDNESAKLVVRMLRQRKEEIKAITSDQEATRRTLCEGQQALSDAFAHAETLLDLFDRLEKAYRIVFPGINACIHGEQGCPKESIVFCAACSGVSHAP